MIRPTQPADVDALVEIAAGTGVFKAHEIETLREVFADYFAENIKHNHRAFTLLHDGRITAFSYHAPAAMTEDTWYLYWIAVRR